MIQAPDCDCWLPSSPGYVDARVDLRHNYEMAFSVESEYKSGGSSSKIVMGHWPIENSNLSLSARLSERGPPN